MDAIKLNDKAAKQVQGLLDAARKINEQLEVYVTAMKDALDVPDEWRLDIAQMAFVALPEAPPAPEEAA